MEKLNQLANFDRSANRWTYDAVGSKVNGKAIFVRMCQHQASVCSIRSFTKNVVVLVVVLTNRLRLALVTK